MIAPWIFELLRRERDWRGALPGIANHLSELPEDRVRAGLDLGAAFEHIEPDRYHAIIAYQLAGPQRDGGRSRQIALEIGWWQAEGRLATVDLQASGSVEALIAACRSLIDDNKQEAATRLLGEHPGASKHAAIAGLRAEIEGRAAEWKTYSANAKRLRGTAAADAFVTAARLARAATVKDWGRHLEAALEADPQHRVAAAMLMDLAVASEDDKLVFDLMRVRCLGLDGYEYSEAVRAISTRLLLADPAHHAGMGRRLAKVAIERAYSATLSEIPGHIALWTLLDAAAAQDGTRSELLPLIMRGLAGPIPDFDRTWLAALGAAICVEAGSTETAHTYAAIVAEHAPSHPIVRELLADANANVEIDLSDDLELLEEDAQPPAVEDLLPDDFDLDLAPLSMSMGYTATIPSGARPVDPRFLDVSVRALDDVPEQPETRRLQPVKRAQAAAAASTPPASASVPSAAPPPAPAAAPSAPTPTAVAPAPAPTATVAPSPAPPSTIDEAWDVDVELFPQRRQTTKVQTLAKPLSTEDAEQAPQTSAPAVPAAPALPAVNPAAPTAPATTEMPASPVPGSRPSMAATPVVPPRLKAPSTPPRPKAPSIPPSLPPISPIPAAAARVLQQAGVPRPLPKLPPPPNARPRADRVAVAVDIVLKHDNQTTHVHTRDLSSSGFFAVTTTVFEMGTIVECEIRMPVTGELSGKTFTVRAKAVRKDPTGVGFALVDPPLALNAAIAAYSS